VLEASCDLLVEGLETCDSFMGGEYNPRAVIGQTLTVRSTPVQQSDCSERKLRT
jgi:hypothetical protein